MAIRSSEKRIEWVNGMPVPVTDKPFTKETTRSLVNISMSTEYTPKYKRDSNGCETEELEEGEERFIGLAVGEVMILRACDQAAWGDLDAFKYLMDRVIGKPVQATENININGTIEDYLSAVADQVTVQDVVSEPVAILMANPFATKESERRIQDEYGVFDNEAAEFLDLKPMKELPKPINLKELLG